jgi:hypothetical protein
MKLKSLLFVGLLAFTSCANQTEGFSISKFYPLAPGCDIVTNQKDTVAGNGFLDVAAGSAQFFIGVDIVGAENIQQEAVAVGTTSLERENRNRPLITQQVVTYRLSKPVGRAPKPYLTNISLPFNETGEVIGGIQLISPDLATQLFDGLTPPAGPAPSGAIEDFVDIFCEVEFKGEFSATKTPFTTGTMTFPIRAYRSLPNPCPAGIGYLRFADDPTTAKPDFCNYAGMSTTQLIAPSPPVCCPVGSLGC